MRIYNEKNLFSDDITMYIYYKKKCSAWKIPSKVFSLTKINMINYIKNHT